MSFKAHRFLRPACLPFHHRGVLGQIAIDSISKLIVSSDKDEFQALRSLSPGQQGLYSTWQVEAEVNNGGFNQYYFNIDYRFSKLAVDGFRLLMAPNFAKLMQRANDTFDAIKLDLAKFKDGTPEGFSKSYSNNPLNALDKVFYKLYQEENLSKLRIKYIRSHLEEFTQS